MFDRFTKQARSCFPRARACALAAGHDRIGADHLLDAILGDAGCVASRLLRRLGGSPTEIRPRGAEGRPGGCDDARSLEFSDAATRSLESSLSVALRLGHDHIGTGHLLLAIAACGDPGVGALSRAIDACPDAESVLAAIVAECPRFPDERGPWWRRTLRRLRPGAQGDGEVPATTMTRPADTSGPDVPAPDADEDSGDEAARPRVGPSRGCAAPSARGAAPPLSGTHPPRRARKARKAHPVRVAVSCVFALAIGVLGGGVTAVLMALLGESIGPRTRVSVLELDAPATFAVLGVVAVVAACLSVRRLVRPRPPWALCLAIAYIATIVVIVAGAVT